MFLLEFEQDVGYIYKITNKLNNKIYIGKTTKDVNRRWLTHLGNSKHYDVTTAAFKSFLYLAMQKDGVENFEVEEVEVCTLDILNEREQFWIRELKSNDPNIGYNISPGGDGGALFKGHKHSQETKQKMSADRMGEKNANYGNRWSQSDELKAKHSDLSSGEGNGMYGKHHTDETKNKISAANKGKPKIISPESAQHRKELLSKNSKGRIPITNGEQNYRVWPHQLQEYESKGFHIGITNKKIKTQN